MSDPTKVVHQLEIAKVKPYGENAKLHDDEQIATLANAIERFGFDQPISVDGNMVIIKGHGRWLAMQKLGRKFIPGFIRSDLSPNEVRAARLSDNRVISNQFDLKIEQAELADLASLEVDLDNIGYREKELEFLTKDLADFDESAFVDDIETAVIEHERETGEATEAAAEREIPLSKAFGFKSLPAGAVVDVQRFIARLENETGKKGPAALIHFVRELTAA